MSDYFVSKKHPSIADGVESPSSPNNSPLAVRSNPLSSKLTSVLSASYADSDIRDALSVLDKRGLENNAETRRQLRLDVQKEVIESNGEIIREFGHVAEVCRWEIAFRSCPESIDANTVNSNSNALA